MYAVMLCVTLNHMTDPRPLFGDFYINAHFCFAFHVVDHKLLVLHGSVIENIR